METRETATQKQRTKDLTKSAFMENVFGVSSIGEVSWRVPPGAAPGDNDPYVDLYASGGSAVLLSWSGFTREVVPATGTIVSELFTM
jgi:hypothetical protein